jgi:hypothetical protein
MPLAASRVFRRHLLLQSRFSSGALHTVTQVCGRSPGQLQIRFESYQKKMQALLEGNCRPDAFHCFPGHTCVVVCSSPPARLGVARFYPSRLSRPPPFSSFFLLLPWRRPLACDRIPFKINPFIKRIAACLGSCFFFVKT